MGRDLLKALTISLLVESLVVREAQAQIELYRLMSEGQLVMQLPQDQIFNLIKETAIAAGMDPNLVLAIAAHETNFDPLKVRYEPKWRYLKDPTLYALKLGISVDTEITLQKMSYGCLQVMGSVLRELSYSGILTKVIDEPQLGIFYGVKKLQALKNKYPREHDLISAFNCGTPKVHNGKYSNQLYVDDVVDRLTKLRSIK